MNYRLSDTERTLLSGYFDGEISSDERQTAEGLLARSKEAQTYLNDLRSLRNVTHEGFPLPMIGAGIAGAAFSTKLTASSIASAAGKTAAVKGLFAGSWGAASIATAAASIGVVMALNFGGGRIDNSGDNLRPTASARPASAAKTSAATADTGSLVVPLMTSDELVGFAVKGTLPIDQHRNRYLTVQTEGSDSFRLELHRGKPNDMATQFQQVNLPETPQLDTVEQAIRRSVKALPNGMIGLRNDIWNNRQRLVNLLRERNLRPDLDSRLAVEHQRLAQFRAARAAQVAKFQQQVHAVQVNIVQQGWGEFVDNFNGVIASSTPFPSQQAWDVWESTTFPVIIQPDAFPQSTESVALTMQCQNNPMLVKGNNVVVDLLSSPVFQELEGELPAELLALPRAAESPNILMLATEAPPPHSPAIPVRIARPRPRANDGNGLLPAESQNNQRGLLQFSTEPPDGQEEVIIIRTQEILEHARQQLQRADSLLRQLRQQENQPESSEQP